MDRLRAVRNIANFVNLSTPLGLVLAGIGRGRLQRRGSMIVADNVRLPVPAASAMTVGSVVLVFRTSADELEHRVPDVFAHEEEHTWQWAYCLGLPFLPLYFVSAGWSWFRTGDRASANHFERQAGLADGGYLEREKNPMRESMQRLLRR